MQTSPLDTLIQSRRSIRKYKKEIPDPALIEKMVCAASFAPSPSNTQPVRFFNITSPETRTRLGQAMEEGRADLIARIHTQALSNRESRRKKNIVHYYFRYAEFMCRAPVILAVGAQPHTESFSRRLNEESTKDLKDSAITLGLALKGFLLKAQELGLGTCVLTAPLNFIPQVNDLLGIEDVTIMCFTTVGFPAEAPKGVARKNIREIYKEI